MKEKIAKIAGNLFLKLGFKNVSMDDIAGEMCISKKTIYKYFCNKEALIEEAIDVTKKTFVEKFEAIEAQNFNAIEGEFQKMQIFHDLVQQEDTSPLFQLKKYYPEIYEKRACEKLETFDDFHLRNINRGIKDGLFRQDINPETVVLFSRLVIFGINERTESEKEARKLETQALEYHIRSIATPKGLEELEKQLRKLN